MDKDPNLSSNDETLLKELTELKQNYLNDLPNKIKQIKTCLTDLNDTNREIALRLLHNIAGTAKTFGFENLGVIAQLLEVNLLENEWEAEEYSKLISQLEKAIQ